MAAQFVANLIRLKEEGFTPDRDLILALTADEEGGDFNGVDWLVKNHKDLIDAEFAINEGGGGKMRKGKYLTNEVQASEKVYPGLPARGDQRRRPQLAAGEGQRDLPPVGGARAAGDVRLPGAAERGDARATSSARPTVEADPKLAADMRAVARPTPDLAAAARLSAPLPYYNSMMRTTCVATRLAGGHANNALPQLATRERELPHPARRVAGVGEGQARRGARRSEDHGVVRRRGATRASRRRCAPTS